MLAAWLFWRHEDMDPCVGVVQSVPEGSALRIMLALVEAMIEPRPVAGAEATVTPELPMVTTPVKSSIRSN